MGHLVGNSIYKKLGKKIDGFSYRTPWNEKLHLILKELYSEEDADVIIKMPYFFSNLDRIAVITGYDRSRLRGILENLANRGLVIDILANGDNHYTVSPVLIGIFEFTMMRKADEIDIKRWARLFHDYLSDGVLYAKNFSHGEKGGILRTLPYEEAIKEEDHVHILDYERADALIEEQKKFAVEICSCRHEKHHLGEKKCKVPLESCTTIGIFADSIVRNNLGRHISKTEMKEKLAQSKERGVVLCADNVQKRINYICHCCGCCCNVLTGVSKHGYPNVVVTSNYIAEINDELCNGCGKCAKACQIHAIKMERIENPQTKKKARPVLDGSICLGCGLCVLKCDIGALKLAFRGERVLTPETTFERLILQYLEAGTLANQLFDDPRNISHKFMRGFVGAFLSLHPVKKALVSDTLRSRFFDAAKKLSAIQGRGWAIDL
jgi:Na+-translocating ferredoxin:NAD+ oxidoreductase RNF subunit RnfB